MTTATMTMKGEVVTTMRTDGAEVNDNPTVDVPDDNEMEGGEPLIENAPPLDGIQQIPDNPPGGIPGVGIADEGEDGVAMNHDIPGDTDDEASLGIQEWMTVEVTTQQMNKL